MKIRKIITSGCSFSEALVPYTWPNHLEAYIKTNVDPTVKFDHRGLSSQGQDLIQKKSAHAIYEALEMGYKPEEIAVIVMWSSNDRRSFYIDNPDMIDDIVDNWKQSQQGWHLQFADLKNQLSNPDEVTSLAATNNNIKYNTKGGWFITSAYVKDDLGFIKNMFMMANSTAGPGPISTSIENILMLQYLCKSKGIKLYQQFFMDNVLNDFEKNKNHQIVKYLYNDLDYSTIISTKGMYEYMGPRPELYVDYKNPHPNGLGHKLWVNEVILPFLEDQHFFD